MTESVRTIETRTAGLSVYSSDVSNQPSEQFIKNLNKSALLSALASFYRASCDVSSLTMRVFLGNNTKSQHFQNNNQPSSQDINDTIDRIIKLDEENCTHLCILLCLQWGPLHGGMPPVIRNASTERKIVVQACGCKDIRNTTRFPSPLRILPQA